MKPFLNKKLCYKHVLMFQVKWFCSILDAKIVFAKCTKDKNETKFVEVINLYIGDHLKKGKYLNKL